MTVRSLINYLIGLDPEMEVAISIDDEFFPICDIESDIIEMTDEETGEEEKLFVLAPCYGHQDDEEIVENFVNPNLN